MLPERNAAVEPDDEDTTITTEAPDDPLRAVLRLIDRYLSEDDDDDDED